MHAILSSNFQRLYPDKDASIGYWFIPKSRLSSTPLNHEQMQVSGAGPSLSTQQPQQNCGLEGHNAFSNGRPPDASSNQPTDKPNVAKEGWEAEKRGDMGKSKAGKPMGDPIRKPAKRRMESTAAGPAAERPSKKVLGFVLWSHLC